MVCVGFGTNEKWTSKLIRWVTKSECSHVWIEYPSVTWGGRWVVHSWGSAGVVKVPLEQVEKDYPTHRSYECSLNIDGGFQWARQRLGARYDYGVIWNGFLLVLHRITGWGWLNDVLHRNAARFSCSEFVAGFLKAAGVPGTEHMDPEFITPEALREFCAWSEDFWSV